VNYLDVLLDVSLELSVFCQMSEGKLSQYSVGCLMANYAGILLDVSWRMAQYFVRCLSVHYLGMC
jgi:hypothetical protein